MILVLLKYKKIKEKKQETPTNGGVLQLKARHEMPG